MKRKYLGLAGGLLLAALTALLLQPLRTWASQEGSYIYHAIFTNGPGVFYVGNAWTGNDNVAYSGVMISSGTQTSHAGATYLTFLGALGTDPGSCTIGQVYFNTASNFLKFCGTGSAWRAAWTPY